MTVEGREQVFAKRISSDISKEVLYLQEQLNKISRQHKVIQTRKDFQKNVMFEDDKLTQDDQLRSTVSELKEKVL